MSGVFGLMHHDGAPVSEGLQTLGAMLARRGPEGTTFWQDGSVGVGHCQLATTPEAEKERLPLVNAASGCVITADVRLDNRDELMRALGRSDPNVGDGELVLAAYLAWGTSCVERLLGDFAFGIWDPRRRRFFCARDPFGMRPFCYHHAAGKLFAFASEVPAIVALPEIPYRINEGRIADFLVPSLEGIDKTSTFFEDVFRLPPAHAICVTLGTFRLWRYYELRPGPELRLSSDRAYEEAFLETFEKAVACRLRGGAWVGSMLSGGMDSGSVVAVARKLRADAGEEPLKTFSGVWSEPSECVETRAIHAALTMSHLDPTTVHPGQLAEFMPALGDLAWTLDEPFDNHMTLLRVMYLAAKRRGLKVLLDGVAGDTVLSEGNHLSRLLRAGRWAKAYREASGIDRFYGGAYPAWKQLAQSARGALVHNVTRQLRWRMLGHRLAAQRARKEARDSIICPRFARRVSLAERMHVLGGHALTTLSAVGNERTTGIEHPYLTVGRERYDRVASAMAIEPRDPYLDKRVVELCVRMPRSQMLDGGWPKAVLRRAMAGHLPDAVRWRRGKEHVGSRFTSAMIDEDQSWMKGIIEESWEILSPYVRIGKLKRVFRGFLCEDDGATSSVYDAAHLAVWLRRFGRRPVHRRFDNKARLHEQTVGHAGSKETAPAPLHPAAIAGVRAVGGFDGCRDG